MLQSRSGGSATCNTSPDPTPTSAAPSGREASVLGWLTMSIAERPHWHIDYLRRHTTLEEIWFCYDRKSRQQGMNDPPARIASIA
jgi:hypothetical protein